MTPNAIEKMLELIQRFPTLWELSTDAKREAILDCFSFISDKTPEGSVTLAVAFDAVAFAKFARENQGGHGEDCAARFILSVWNPSAARHGGYGLPVFDVHEALGCWDPDHRAAFVEWAAAPFWP